MCEGGEELARFSLGARDEIVEEVSDACESSTKVLLDLILGNEEVAHEHLRGQI